MHACVPPTAASKHQGEPNAYLEAHCQSADANSAARTPHHPWISQPSALLPLILCYPNKPICYFFVRSLFPRCPFASPTYRISQRIHVRPSTIIASASVIAVKCAPHTTDRPTNTSGPLGLQRAHARLPTYTQPQSHPQHPNPPCSASAAGSPSCSSCKHPPTPSPSHCTRIPSLTPPAADYERTPHPSTSSSSSQQPTS